jgi:hypothetical protein
MQNQTTIVREYATGMVDGFMNDLAAGHIKLEVHSETDLIEAWIRYVAACGADSAIHPSAAASDA